MAFNQHNHVGIKLITILLLVSGVRGFVVTPPPVSLATGLPNRIYEWRKQSVRYQVYGDPSSSQAVVLVHGLFANSDHWRHTIKGLGDKGYRVYALDLLGSGYSSKPVPWDNQTSELVNGELFRFLDDEDHTGTKPTGLPRIPPVLKSVQLGTTQGGIRTADVELRHPLGSPYNFYTWSEQVADFTRDIVLKGDERGKATLICNSKGTIVSLQAVTDCPDLFDGVFILNPTFREMHSAEVPKIFVPFLKSIQYLLRKKGRLLYDRLARPDIVKKILKEPYAVKSAVDDELVDALLLPLLTPGAAEVVFDTLSYSAGPLPEQQLSSNEFPRSVPVWVSYGTSDPWTPEERVRSMTKLDTVERVIALEGIGHCPHDEAPEIVNDLIIKFLQRVKMEKKEEKQQLSLELDAGFKVESDLVLSFV